MQQLTSREILAKGWEECERIRALALPCPECGKIMDPAHAKVKEDGSGVHVPACFYCGYVSEDYPRLTFGMPVTDDKQQGYRSKVE